MKTTDRRMAAAVAVPSPEAALPIEVQIERFLDGETDGHDVLELLYGRVEDEPVPERFRALIRSGGHLRLVTE